MKADVINALTGMTVLAVPGVNTLTQLELMLNELGNKKSAVIIAALNEYLASHPELEVFTQDNRGGW